MQEISIVPNESLRHFLNLKFFIYLLAQYSKNQYQKERYELLVFYFL